MIMPAEHLEFKNYSKVEEYKCTLYKDIEGRLTSQVFTGITATKAAIKDGWHTTYLFKLPQDAVEYGEKNPDTDAGKTVAVIKEASDIRNVLLNYKHIDDIERLKQAYVEFTGKKISSRVTRIETVRDRISKIDLNIEENTDYNKSENKDGEE